MKKRLALLVSLLLLVSMVGSIFVSCTISNSNDSSDSESDTTGSGSLESETEGNGNENETEGENGNNSGSGEKFPSVLEGSYAASIEYADSILNGVNYYYTSADRESAVLENLEMSLEYGLTQSGNKQVVALKNKAGASYLSNTMDVYVRMNNGSTYYASTSKATTTSNLFRLGYYFYEARFEGQDFCNNIEPLVTKKVKLEEGLAAHTNDITLISNENGELTVKATDDKSGSFDPYMSFVDGSHNSNKNNPFTFVEVTMKSDAKSRTGQIYINTGKGFNNAQRYAFALISDGNYHTYNIPLFAIPEYEGKITGIRFDMDAKNDAEITIKEINLVVSDTSSSLPVGLSIARSFNAYSDKMHHVIQVSALTETNNIASVGMVTKLSADTVEKLIVKDKNGTHDSLEGVDWATVEYIGFDIKDAGIFGYILPYDNNSGTLSVTLSEGIYFIEQNCTPKDGTIKPSEEGTNNANDLFMGQRVYTDDNHTFDEFLYEAECERNPVLSKF